MMMLRFAEPQDMFLYNNATEGRGDALLKCTKSVTALV
jgi:hypothetical protein